MRGHLVLMLSLASAMGACEESLQSTPLALWSGPRFSVAYPASWVVRSSSGGDSVTFDGTHAEGPWVFGPSVTITRNDRSAKPSSAFESGCGSHVCDSTLTINQGAYKLVFGESHSSDDWRNDEKASEKRIRALAERVLPTLKDR